MCIRDSHGADSTSPAVVETVQARVVESQMQEVPVNLRSTGTVHARETAVLSAQVMGRIQQVLVHEGDSVRTGQTLIVLDDAALRTALEQAQAGLKAAQNAQTAAQTNASLATSTLNRYKQLEQEKSVSPQEMDEVSQRAEAAEANFEAVRAQTDEARAQVNGAHTMLSYTRVAAPFSGIVTARMVDPGTMAAPGVPLLQVDQAGALQLDATVDESAIGTVSYTHLDWKREAMMKGELSCAKEPTVNCHLAIRNPDALPIDVHFACLKVAGDFLGTGAWKERTMEQRQLRLPGRTRNHRGKRLASLSSTLSNSISSAEALQTPNLERDIRTGVIRRCV